LWLPELTNRPSGCPR